MQKQDASRSVRLTGLWPLSLALGLGGCSVGPQDTVREAQSAQITANPKGSEAAAVQVISYELGHLLRLASYDGRLMPGMKEGLPETGSYLAEDFDPSSEPSFDTEVVLRVWEQYIRDALWHASFPMYRIDRWQAPDYERPVNIRRTPNDSLLVTVQLSDTAYFGVIFGFLRNGPTLPFIFPFAYATASSLEWDVFARLFVFPRGYHEVPVAQSLSCGDMARAQGYLEHEAHCFADVWKSHEDTISCVTPPEDAWVCEAVVANTWHDQWRSLGISFLPNGEAVECGACLVYNNAISDTAYWQWTGPESDGTGDDVIELRMGGVLSLNGRWTPQEAYGRLCRTKVEEPQSPGDFDCDNSIKGCVYQDPVLNQRHVWLQSEGWPALDCNRPPPEDFIDAQGICTGDDCIRVRLTQQSYHRFEGVIQRSHSSEDRSPGVVDGIFARTAERWGTKRALVSIGRLPAISP